MDGPVNRPTGDDGPTEHRGAADPLPVQPAGGGAAADLWAELREMWQRSDPVPAGLADRVRFALEVDGLARLDLELDLELLRLQQVQPAGSGARGGDEVRTVTFGSESVTVMLAISDVAGGHRIDGWVAPGGRRGIEVRTSTGATREHCDETGRFALPFVPPGHFQLVLVADPLEPTTPRAVVTPALTL